MTEIEQDIIVFVVEYYETLQKANDEILGAYNEAAKLVISQNNEPLKVFTSNFHKNLPLGKRQILKMNGHIRKNKMFVQVQSECEQPYKKLLIDEVFLCTLNETTILINYHSIHINPLIEPVSFLPPPKPKTVIVKKVVEKPAEEVASIDDVKLDFCILCSNIPFKYPPKDFLPVVAKYGKVNKYVQGKGKLLVEFSGKDKREMNKLLRRMISEREQWNGRVPRFDGCQNGMPDFP